MLYKFFLIFGSIRLCGLEYVFQNLVAVLMSYKKMTYLLSELYLNLAINSMEFCCIGSMLLHATQQWLLLLCLATAYRVGFWLTKEMEFPRHDVKLTMEEDQWRQMWFLCHYSSYLHSLVSFMIYFLLTPFRKSCKFIFCFCFFFFFFIYIYFLFFNVGQIKRCLHIGWWIILIPFPRSFTFLRYECNENFSVVIFPGSAFDRQYTTYIGRCENVECCGSTGIWANHIYGFLYSLRSYGFFYSLYKLTPPAYAYCQQNFTDMWNVLLL